MKQQIEDFIMSSPTGLLCFFLNDYVIWEKPLVKFADGDDPIFTEYKKIIRACLPYSAGGSAKAYGVEVQMPTIMGDGLICIQGDRELNVQRIEFQCGLAPPWLAKCNRGSGPCWVCYGQDAGRVHGSGAF